MKAAYHFASQGELARLSFEGLNPESEEDHDALSQLLADAEYNQLFMADTGEPGEVFIRREHVGFWHEIAARYGVSVIESIGLVELGEHGEWEYLPSALEGGGFYLVKRPPPPKPTPEYDDPAIPF